MKKRSVATLLMVFVLMITGCGNSNSADEQNGTNSQIADNTDQTNTGENGTVSADEAENILREYLISVNNWESNYVLEPLDPVLGKIENDEIFKFEIRFTDDTDEVGGRLIDNYAITTDGEKIFWYNPADDEWVEQIIENVSTEGVADYPAAIMVNGTIYLLEGIPMPAEVDESAIIGYTESFTDTFPENNGETNFNPELGMPYAQVDGGIAVLYQNEWYLATPHEMNLSNLYSCDYYSIMLPQGWAIDSESNEASLVFSEEIIATITVEEDFEYGQNIESIVSNWIGMRTSILSEDSIETTNKETVFHKTVVGWEQSAAEEISGESIYPNEIHYFYISKDNLFIDIFLRNEEYDEDVENIVKSFHR